MIDPGKPDYANTPASDRRPAYAFALCDPTARPLVTVLTPFWNNARSVFHETARCVFRQSLQQWEWLIINDAATDPEALHILDEYRHRDPRIRVIDNPRNLGLPATRNVGFEAAAAEYVFLLDDDDLIEPTALEMMYWCLESFPEYAVVNGWSVGFGAKEYLWAQGFEQGPRLLEYNCATGRAMIRRSAHRRAGGYDATIRDGLEDWDFWLRLASQGMVGFTIPQYLDWYRRRDDHRDRWANLDGGARYRAFCDRLREKYPGLFGSPWPVVQRSETSGAVPVLRDPPPANRLEKTRRRLLLIVPRLGTDDFGETGLKLVRRLVEQGWEVTVVATRSGGNAGAPRFAEHTPDVFILRRFLKPADLPVFLRYLIESRRHDVVLIGHSELGYQLLPYLTSVCPEPTYLDFCHEVGEPAFVGEGLRLSAGYQDYLSGTFVAAARLQEELIAAGADPERIRASCTNDDPDRKIDRMALLLDEATRTDRPARLPVQPARVIQESAHQAARMLELSESEELARRHRELLEELLRLDDPGSEAARTPPPEPIIEPDDATDVLSARIRSCVQRVRRQRQCLQDMSEAKAWLEQQVENWKRESEAGARLLREQQQHIRELEEAKAWLEQQVENWKREAEEREKALGKPRAYLNELQQANAWLEEQRATWEAAARESERVAREREAWIRELEQAKAFLTEERDHWRSLAERHDEAAACQLAELQARLAELNRKNQALEETVARLSRYVARIQETRWWRLGRRVAGLEEPPAASGERRHT
ncbi:MAG: glycosyltransferase [Phycisphaerae bacterium]